MSPPSALCGPASIAGEQDHLEFYLSDRLSGTGLRRTSAGVPMLGRTGATTGHRPELIWPGDHLGQARGGWPALHSFPAMSTEGGTAASRDYLRAAGSCG